MIHFVVISLLPDMFQAFSANGITGRACQKALCKLTILNPRDFTDDPLRRVDERPYGGGPGMVMMAEPLYQSILAAKALVPEGTPVSFLSPQGSLFRQETANTFAKRSAMILVCGRYEGVDQRLLDSCIDEHISLGEFVVSGGELPAMMILDAVTRLLPGALGHPASALQDSFMQAGELDHPHYTRPEIWREQPVPKVLLSGHHREIETWRRQQKLIASRQ